MAERTLQLNEAAQVVLDATGYGLVDLGPSRHGTQWRVTTLAVSATASDPMPSVSAYIGTPSPTGLISASYNGAQNSTDLTALLHPGQRLTVEWKGGPPGARCTASVFGDLLVREPDPAPAPAPAPRRLWPW